MHCRHACVLVAAAARRRRATTRQPLHPETPRANGRSQPQRRRGEGLGRGKADGRGRMHANAVERRRGGGSAVKSAAARTQRAVRRWRGADGRQCANHSTQRRFGRTNAANRSAAAEKAWEEGEPAGAGGWTPTQWSGDGEGVSGNGQWRSMPVDGGRWRPIAADASRHPPTAADGDSSATSRRLRIAAAAWAPARTNHEPLLASRPSWLYLCGFKVESRRAMARSTTNEQAKRTKARGTGKARATGRKPAAWRASRS